VANETVAAATDVDGEKTGRTAWAILVAMGLGGAIAMMFSTVIDPALPHDQGGLGSEPVGADVGIRCASTGFVHVQVCI
jgi:hypothetical protein